MASAKKLAKKKGKLIAAQKRQKKKGIFAGEQNCYGGKKQAMECRKKRNKRNKSGNRRA